MSGPIYIKKKRRPEPHPHHGGAWKVAYADFVTAMMAFFMVMWLMGTDQETARAIEAYFKAEPLTRDGMSGSGMFNGGEIRDNMGSKGRFEEKSLEQPHYAAPIEIEEYAILKNLSDYYQGSAFTRDIEGDVVKYTITKRIYFEKGSANLKETVENRELLGRLIEVFKQHDGTILIEGFSDSEQDWILSYARAMSIMRLLISHGANASNLIPASGFNQLSDGTEVKKVNPHDQGSVRFTLKRVRN